VHCVARLGTAAGAAVLLALVFILVLGAAPAAARGPFYETVPWSSPEFADTSLVLGLGIETVPSPRRATLVQAALAPWRLGPLRVAATWSFVGVRAAGGESFGLGDPKLYARLRVAGTDSTAWRVWLDGHARIPTAQAKLFPFAWGGQEVEAGTSVARVAPWTWSAGASHTWTEPGTGDVVQRRDLPHAWRAFALVRRTWGAWVPQVRFDQSWMDDTTQRQGITASITRIARRGIHVTVGGGVEAGTRRDRAADSWLHLRFATRLR
jgi:hypothetical protein